MIEVKKTLWYQKIKEFCSKHKKDLIGAFCCITFYVCYIITGFRFLNFTLLDYWQNWQFVADIYVFYFIFYGIHFKIKFLMSYPEFIGERYEKIIVNYSDYNSQVLPKEKRYKEKKWRIILHPIAFIFYIIVLGFIGFGLLTEFKYIVWGSKYNYVSLAQFWPYVIFVMGMVSWMIFFGISSIKEYKNISRQISRLSDYSPIINYETIIGEHFKEVFKYHMKITRKIFYLCSPLQIIGSMYLLLFQYTPIGLTYLVIGWGCIGTTLWYFWITERDLKTKIREYVIVTKQDLVEKMNGLLVIDEKGKFKEIPPQDQLVQFSFWKEILSDYQKIKLKDKIAFTNFTFLISFFSASIIFLKVFIEDVEIFIRQMIFVVNLLLFLIILIYWLLRKQD